MQIELSNISDTSSTMDSSKTFGQFTSDVNGFVEINIDKVTDSLACQDPIAIPALLDKAVNEAPSATALAVKRNGTWIKWTYQNYQKVRTI